MCMWLWVWPLDHVRALGLHVQECCQSRTCRGWLSRPSTPSQPANGPTCVQPASRPAVAYCSPRGGCALLVCAAWSSWYSLGVPWYSLNLSCMVGDRLVRTVGPVALGGAAHCVTQEEHGVLGGREAGGCLCQRGVGVIARTRKPSSTQHVWHHSLPACPPPGMCPCTSSPA